MSWVMKTARFLGMAALREIRLRVRFTSLAHDLKQQVGLGAEAGPSYDDLAH